MLPLADRQRVDEICDEFEAAWLRGDQPRIEDYLADVSAELRPHLLGDLIRLEVDYRARDGGECDRAEYARRFEDDTAVLYEVFDRDGEPATQSFADREDTAFEPEERREISAALPGRIGDYEIIEEIARGGMGVVYKARQPRLNRVVALKMILAGEFAGDEQIKRFHAEAEAAALLDHPAIVPIYEIGEHDGRPFFSMGYVEGHSLSERLAAGPLSSPEAAALLAELADAVHYAHERGVIHRDLKPSNVLLTDGRGSRIESTLVESRESRVESQKEEEKTPPGELPPTSFPAAARQASGLRPSTLDPRPCSARITDFGLAKRVDADGELTSTGQIMGTPGYMPPEQAGGRVAEIDRRSDVYSLGAILYATLTGHPPFQAAAMVETLRQVQEEEPVPPGMIDAAVDRDLENICLKCLDKRREHRYQTAQELAADVRRHLAGETVLARRAGAAERIVKWIRRRPTAAALLFVSALSLVVTAALIVGWRYHLKLQDEKHESDRQRDLATAAKREADAQRRTALTAKQTAEDEHEEAERQRAAAEKLRKEAERQRSTAITQKAEAERQRTAAELQRDRTRHVLYTSDINLAHRAWQTAQLPRMQSLLAKTSPQQTGVDLRGWEWYYLNRLQYGWRLQFNGHTNGPNDLLLTVDGKSVLTSSYDQSVRFWDPNTGKQTGMYSTAEFKAAPTSIGLSSDGRLLVMGLSTGKVLIRDLQAATTKPIVTVGSGQHPQAQANISPDGKRIVTWTGLNYSTVQVFDVQTGKELGRLKHPRSISSALFTKDSKRVFTGAFNNVWLWDFEKLELIRQFPHGGIVIATALNPDETLLASGSFDDRLLVWDVASGKLVKEFRGHTGTVHAAAFSPDGKLLAAGAKDGSIRVRRLRDGQEIKVLRGHTRDVSKLFFLPDGKRLVSLSWDGVARLWHLDDDPEATTFGRPQEKYTSVAFNHDGTQLGATANGMFYLYQRDGRVLSVKGMAGNAYGEVAAHPTKNLWAIATTGGDVELWDQTAGKSHRLKGHQHGVMALSFSGDGKLLATAANDKLVKVWDVDARKLVRTLTGHTNMVWGVSFRPDGKEIVSAGHDYSLMFWNWPQGVNTAARRIYNFPNGTTYGPDGSFVAVPTNWNGVELVDRQTLKPRVVLSGHSDTISGIAITPDGRRVVTASGDTTVMIWDPTTGREALTLKCPAGVRDVAISRNGQHIAAAGAGFVRVWHAPIQYGQSPKVRPRRPPQ